MPFTSVFATPLYSDTLGFEADRLALRDFILAHEKDEFRYGDSPQTAHKNVFESEFDFLNWQSSVIEKFKSKLYDCLMGYVVAVNGFNAEQLKQLSFKTESWFHITRSGGYFQPHNHPLASVSLIYCVDPGDEEPADLREAGQVLFSDPRFGSNMYLDIANRDMKRTFSFNGLRFRFKPDEICIFPSYLQHYVEPYRGDKPRITIAANFSFGLK